MATWQEDEKFRRDTLMLIDREYGRTVERKRIVEIVRRQRDFHSNSPYNDKESTGRLQVATTYVIEVLDSILAEIEK